MSFDLFCTCGPVECQCEPKLMSKETADQVIHHTFGWMAIVVGCAGLLLPATIFAQTAFPPGPARIALTQTVEQCQEQCKIDVVICLDKVDDKTITKEGCMATYEKCQSNCLLSPEELAKLAEQTKEEAPALTEEECQIQCKETVSKCSDLAGNDTKQQILCSDDYAKCLDVCKAATVTTDEKSTIDEQRIAAEEQAKIDAAKLASLQLEIKPLVARVDSLMGRIGKLRKRSVVIPDAVTRTMNRAALAIKMTKETKTVEEANRADLAGEIKDVVEELLKVQRTLDRLENLNKITGRVDTQLVLLGRRAAELVVLAKKSPEFTATSRDMANRIVAIRKAYADAKILIKNGRVDDGFTLIERSVLAAADEAMENYSQVIQARRLSATIVEMNKAIDNYAKQIAVIKSRGGSTTGVTVALQDFRRALTNLQTIVNTKPLAMDKVLMTLEQIEDLRDGIANIIDQLNEKPVVNPIDVGIKLTPALAAPDIEGVLK